MCNAKVWLFSGMLVAMLSGTAMFVGTSSSLAQPGSREEHRQDQSYWRHHDGRWSYWDARDRRWYYTDGSHWFYHDNNRWHPYRFDRNFGRDAFVRGQYQPPRDGVTIVVPTHQVYQPRRGCPGVLLGPADCSAGVTGPNPTIMQQAAK